MSDNPRSPRAAIERRVQETPPLLAAQYDDEKVTIQRNPDYHATVTSIKRAFNSLQDTPDDQILISSRFQEFNDTLQITDDLWPDVLPRLTLVTISLDRGSQSNNHTSNTGSQGKASTMTGTGAEMAVPAGPSSTTWQQPEDTRPFSGYKIPGGPLIKPKVPGRKGKPVIYLFPPSPTLNIHVQLCLIGSWSFSALYPPTEITRCGPDANETVAWTVDAKSDGMLFDHATRREVAYLFWEAHKTSGLPSSPAISRPGTPTTYPAQSVDRPKPMINSNNAVLIPLEKVTGYIDDALLALGLHIEARTSFITYWLPDLQKHKFIALRFLPQAEFEAEAPLTVTPAPEVTTRVFMLFKGIHESEVGRWQTATAKAREDGSTWREVVGVDVEKATDASLFRVLEWGGMEIV